MIFRIITQTHTFHPLVNNGKESTVTKVLYCKNDSKIYNYLNSTTDIETLDDNDFKFVYKKDRPVKLPDEILEQYTWHRGSLEHAFGKTIHEVYDNNRPILHYFGEVYYPCQATFKDSISTITVAIECRCQSSWVVPYSSPVNSINDFIADPPTGIVVC